MVYPIVIMGVAIAIVAILMIFVVPQFQKIFTDMLKGNARMPALTQTIIDISDFMKENYILTGLIIVGVILFVKIFFKTKIGIRVWDTAAIKLPKIGDLVMKSTVARFTRTFGTLLASGVPILEALTITRGTINNSLISDALSRVHDRVRDGENLSTPLDQQKIFPTMVTSMVEVGRRNRTAARNAQPHSGQLRRRSRQLRRGNNVYHRTYNDCIFGIGSGDNRHRPLPADYTNHPEPHRRLI